MTPFCSYGKHSIRPSTYLPNIQQIVLLEVCSLRFVVTEPSRMKLIRTEGCHLGHFQKFVGTACCTYGQSITTNTFCASDDVNSLRPCDTVWRYRTRPTLAQVMACCLTAQTYHLSQRWLDSILPGAISWKINKKQWKNYHLKLIVEPVTLFSIHSRQ